MDGFSHFFALSWLPARVSVIVWPAKKNEGMVVSQECHVVRLWCSQDTDHLYDQASGAAVSLFGVFDQ